MEPAFLLEQMEHLRAQAERETDPLLKKEHKKTIRHLHQQFRKATKHRNPWFGYLRITATFFTIFLLAFWGAAKLVKTYGHEEAMGAGRLILLAFVVITITMLVMLRLVGPDTYSNVVGGVLTTVQSFLGNKTTSSEASEKSLPKTRPIPQLPKVTNSDNAIGPASQVTCEVSASEPETGMPIPRGE